MSGGDGNISEYLKFEAEDQVPVTDGRGTKTIRLYQKTE
jgi:hypothetical protein